jgi:hypothetical protein
MLVIAIVLGLILAGMGLINLNGWRPMGLQDSAPAFAHAQFYRGRSHF